MIGISKFSHLVKLSVEALLMGISKFRHLVKLFVEAALIGISKVFRSSGKLPQDVCAFLCSTPSMPHPVVETGDRQFADLPTDVLTLVLSLLKTRDAVRTSILSPGWKNVWQYMPNLIFNVSNIFEVNPFRPPLPLEKKKRGAWIEAANYKFITAVHQVLNHHQGSGVVLFKINFQLHNKYACHINRWVSFASRSGAKEIVLQLTELREKSATERPYVFPCNLFAGMRGSSVECLRLSCCYLRPHANFVGFSSLKVLELWYTNINDSAISVFLSVCSFLESLILLRCYGLVNLNIRNQSGTINLAVRWCLGIREINFDSVTVTSFEYAGSFAMLNLSNASIVKARIVLDEPEHTFYTFMKLIGVQCLTWHIRSYGQVKTEGVKMGRFTHLTQLTLVSLGAYDYVSALPFFLRAAPFLEVIHVSVDLFDLPSFKVDGPKPPERTHNNLKKLEITGFSGADFEVDLVFFVLRNAVALELVIIDLNYSLGSLISLSEGRNIEVCQDAIQRLHSMCQSYGVKLVSRY